MKIPRRGFLLGTVASLIPVGCVTKGRTSRAGSGGSTVFTNGVASGDPGLYGVILWTRVAPRPLADSNPKESVPVHWAISKNPAMQDQLAWGTETAHPESAHCIHVEVENLKPDTQYFFQFEALGLKSIIGRTHTLPEPGSPTASFSIAVVSCQNYSTGYFTAYRDIVARDPDLVIHLGDYIYETGGGKVRPYPVEEAMTLADYRSLYTQFRLDPDLQNAHAQFPWILIWDDHEVVNDWGPSHYLPSSHNTRISHEEFLVRKDAAMQAYLEFMPIRHSRKDHAQKPRIYDRTVVGDLLELNRLDVRSFRDRPVCVLDEDRHFEPCEETQAPVRSLLGEQQESWLQHGFGKSQATWNFLVQTTVMAPLDLSAGSSVRYEADSWDNYSVNRDRIADLITEKGIQNVVSLGGNIHASYAGVMFDRQNNEHRTPVLTEIVTTSINAPGGGDERYHDINSRRHENPGIEYFENRHHGYSLLSITHEEIKVEFRIVDDIENPDSTVRTLETLFIQNGKVGTATHPGECTDNQKEG